VVVTVDVPDVWDVLLGVDAFGRLQECRGVVGVQGDLLPAQRAGSSAEHDETQAAQRLAIAVILITLTNLHQWGMSPVIDATELRLLRIVYRRAHGAPDMPSPVFLDESTHELKDQFASNSDLHDESELFHEFQGRASRSSRELDARVITTNDDTVCGDPEPLRERSPLARNVCRKVGMIQDDLAVIQPGWFYVGCKRDVPKDACYIGRSGSCYVWVGPEGRDQLTEFTLTVLKLSSLIKETQTLINPGSVKFSPGDRGG
jgi:hypothetical protein